MSAWFFDMDGTLIDSRADLAATVNHTRRDLGLGELPQAQVLSHVGRGAKYLLAHAIPERAADAGELFNIFMSHYGEHMLESVTLYPGVEETLAALAARGDKLGVNTAKPRFAVDAILKHFRLERFFGKAVVAGGDSSEMKPSPVPLFDCARLMDHAISPDDWMVGDNWTDIQCGVNAGVKTAFCLFGFGVPGDVAPTRSIRSFRELLAG